MKTENWKLVKKKRKLKTDKFDKTKSTETTAITKNIQKTTKNVILQLSELELKPLESETNIQEKERTSTIKKKQQQFVYQLARLWWKVKVSVAC